MKKRITIEQLEMLSEEAQNYLCGWFQNTYRYGDDTIHVFIPEEKNGEFGGIFKGTWDTEEEFQYPTEYIGKIKNHRGRILPLMDITLLWCFLEDHQHIHPQQSVDELWNAVARICKKEANTW